MKIKLAKKGRYYRTDGCEPLHRKCLYCNHQLKTVCTNPVEGLDAFHCDECEILICDKCKKYFIEYDVNGHSYWVLIHVEISFGDEKLQKEINDMLKDINKRLE
jgi:transcription elongation factor Elf1